MMNKTQIEYCDFVWNPVTGCLYDCPYCYAMPQLRRFAGDIRLNKGSEQIRKEARGLYVLREPFKSTYGTVLLSPVGTTPTFHEYRLPMIVQKQKPATILVCSQADLFGDWIPDEWIARVFEAVEAAPWHNYLFMTRNPQRYQRLREQGKLPQRDNCWYGTTITEPNTETFHAEGYNDFVNIEPIQKPFTNDSVINTSWVILGAETGARRGKVIVKDEWIEAVVSTCRRTGTPLFMKSSQELSAAWKKKIVQQIPDGLKRPPEIPVPHCHECEYSIQKPDGKRGTQCFCRIGDGTGATIPQHIEGKYTRTCPPWCRRRSGEITVGQIWEHNSEPISQSQEKGGNRGTRGTGKQAKTKGAKVKLQSGNNESKP